MPYGYFLHPDELDTNKCYVEGIEVPEKIIEKRSTKWPFYKTEVIPESIKERKLGKYLHKKIYDNVLTSMNGNGYTKMFYQFEKGGVFGYNDGYIDVKEDTCQTGGRRRKNTRKNRKQRNQRSRKN
jgi:hypothetical protein